MEKSFDFFFEFEVQIGTFHHSMCCGCVGVYTWFYGYVCVCVCACVCVLSIFYEIASKDFFLKSNPYSIIGAII